ncbi:branched-chain amino acid ABC transporter permease [Chloroflexota bacterium]
MRPCGTYDETYAEDMSIIRTRLQWVLLIIALVLLFLLPQVLSIGWLTIVNGIGIYAIAVLGLQVLTGYAGQISLGQSAFMGVGAYTTFLTVTYWGLPFWVTLPLAGISAGLAGLIFGLSSLRVKGFYLAMSTLAAQFIIPWLIINIAPDITGHTTRVVPPPSIAGFVINTQEEMFYLIFPVTLLTIFLIKNLVRGRMGRAFIAIRDNDVAAGVMGINIFKYKLLAFLVSAICAGVAGCLTAYWLRVVSPDQISLMQSIWFLGMLVIGGLGSISGAIMGVTFVQLFNYLITVIGQNIADAWPSWADLATGPLSPMAFGLIVILTLIFQPRGLAHQWEIIKKSYRLFPFSY